MSGKAVWRKPHFGTKGHPQFPLAAHAAHIVKLRWPYKREKRPWKALLEQALKEEPTPEKVTD